MLADFCWAYATLLTSPLLVTMGLSLTIPLSLVGQMVLEAQYASITYWIGAAIVFISFIFLNRESTETGGAAEEAHSLSSSEALPVQEPTTG